MAFNGCYRGSVRTVVHPSILLLLVTGRPLVQRLLIAYTVDLIRILRELFAITLRHVFTLRVSWTELQEAIEAYERPGSRKRIHYRIRSKLPLSGPVLTTDDISSMVHELLQDSS